MMSSVLNNIGPGKYDDAYMECELLWGEHPASNVVKVSNYFDSIINKKALDLGCGEGKNSIYLASKGFKVKSVDISSIAIKKAQSYWKRHLLNNIDWQISDIRDFRGKPNDFHLVLLTGPLHCFSSSDEVTSTIENAKSLTRIGGAIVLSAFNSREQDFSGHSKHFKPLLLSHDFYINCCGDNWKVKEVSDTDLIDKHPHNNIEHKHSITRLIAIKIN